MLLLYKSVHLPFDQGDIHIKDNLQSLQLNQLEVLLTVHFMYIQV